MRVEMVAAVRRTQALILMKNNDYVGARKKLIDARTSYPGLEYVDEMIKVCDIICAAESQGSGIDWRSVLGINKAANESDIECKYTELIGTLEPIKSKFHIQPALGLVQKAYSLFTDREKCLEFDSRGDASLSPCGSAKLLDTAHLETMNINGGATSQIFSGTKRTVGEGSDESNSEEQPLKRLRSLSGGQFLSVYDQEKTPRLYAQIIGVKSCYQKEINSTDKRHSNELVELYPRKGEVWALYEEWKPFDSCLDPKTRKGCKFHIVEILNDYSAETGVKVALLVKVSGYETIFRRSGNSFQVPAGCLFAFSHNIPVRSRGNMRGLFSGMVLDLDPFTIPEDVFVDTVAAKLSSGSSNNQNSVSPPITSELHLGITVVNQCAGDVAFSSGDQNVKCLDTTSQLRLVSPRTCEEEKSPHDGTSKDENTSLNNFEMDKLSREKLGNLAANKDGEKVAEEIDTESVGVSWDGFPANESQCGKFSGVSDDAVNKLDDKVEVVEAIDSDGGFMDNDRECGNSSSDSDDAFVALRGSEMAEFLTDNNPKDDLKKSVKDLELFIPDGLEDCKTLARFYSNELFTIYQSREDPFFG
ncbi:hypothetical protein MKX03_001714 [Papaver bracteatum]|nr:hypothetical protein MKX03_001714 [Papaver bracteatum]